MKKQAQVDAGAIIRKTRVLKPDNPLDTTIGDMETASTDRIKREIEKRKVVPNTLADQINRVLG